MREAMTESLIKVTITEDRIAIITLHRPQAANAMSTQLLDELNDAIQYISNENVFCTIITGSGNKSFCAGADLKERKGMNDSEVIKAVQYIGKTATNIEELEMPVIAALNGAAFGGGLELALACDLRIAASHVKVGLTETSLAIIPGAGGTQRLPRLIGAGQAKRLIYGAVRVNANEALHMGLIEEVVPAEVLLDSAMKMAKVIARNGPIAVKQAKKSINIGLQMDLNSALQFEHLCYKETIATEDRLEGLRAFSEKRKPNYKGK